MLNTVVPRSLMQSIDIWINTTTSYSGPAVSSNDILAVTRGLQLRQSERSPSGLRSGI
jgi:hypothetical protein